MNIIYTTKAKDDLTHIDWRIREKIINELGRNGYRKNYAIRLPGGEYYRLDLENHIVIGQYKQDNFNVLTVLKKQKIKLPHS
ncbi:MAG TPA: hypothetical protein VJC17_02390 [Candidatus Dojkabacteria bacterium]|nr:hypothetical protein [Candidatus Dojkabacteria bacterium]